MAPSQDDRIGVPKDELEFEPVEARPPKKPWGRRLAIMIALVVGGGVGWHYLGTQIGLNKQDNIPVVRADVAPVKIKPADPGGLEVPDRDKLVYDRLNGESAGTDVESLLPPPEEPMEMPESQMQTSIVPEAAEAAMTTEIVEPMEPVETEEASNTTAESMTEKTTQETQAPVALEPSTVTQATTEQETQTEQTPEAPPPPPVPVETVEAAELVAPPPPPEPEPAAEQTAAASQTTETTQTAVATATTSNTSTNGGFRVQLAALRTHASAESEWNRLRKAHPDILGPFNLFVVMVDKGGNDGVYYRLQAGNMASKESAKAVCDKLAARSVACLAKAIGK